MWLASITRVGSPEPLRLPPLAVRGARRQISEPIASTVISSKRPSASSMITSRTRSSRPGIPGVSHSRFSSSTLMLIAMNPLVDGRDPPAPGNAGTAEPSGTSGIDA